MTLSLIIITSFLEELLDSGFPFYFTFGANENIYFPATRTRLKAAIRIVMTHLRHAYWSICTDLAIALRVPSILDGRKTAITLTWKAKKKSSPVCFQRARLWKENANRIEAIAFVGVAKRFRRNEIILTAPCCLLLRIRIAEDLSPPEITWKNAQKAKI